MNRFSSRRLNIESLETRDLMAGDVSVRLVRGNLVVRGDVQSNYISITPVADGRVKIEGVGCTVNGEASIFANYSADFNIKMGDGNDRVRIGSSTDVTRMPGRLAIDMGTGADFVTMDRVRATDLAISLGIEDDGDDDSLNLNRTAFTGNAVIQTGGGSDTVVFNSFEARVYLKLSTGDGGDDVRITNATAGIVSINLGKGQDELFFAGLNEFLGEVGITGGDDNDRARQAAGTSYVISDETPKVVSFEVDQISI